MRWTWPVLLVLGGCSALVGIDEWAPEGSASGSAGPTSAGSAAGGAGAGDAGGAATAGGTGGGTGASAGSGGSGGQGGDSCGGEVDCYHDPMPEAAHSLALCSRGPPAGSCVSAGWDYCSCDGDVPALFLEYDAGGDLALVTLIAPMAGEPYNLLINEGSYCPGAVVCAAARCGGDSVLYRWTEFGGFGTVNQLDSLQVWRMDAGGACSPDRGGEVYLEVHGL